MRVFDRTERHWQKKHPSPYPSPRVPGERTREDHAIALLLRAFIRSASAFRGPEPRVLCPWTNSCWDVFVLCFNPASRWEGISHNGPTDDVERKTPISAMERPMKANKLPKTDSIQELASFWDSHDLSDFEKELCEVSAPVFESRDSIRLSLQSKEAKAVRKIAESKGVSQSELVHEWVLQKLEHHKRRCERIAAVHPPPNPPRPRPAGHSLARRESPPALAAPVRQRIHPIPAGGSRIECPR